MRKGYQPWHSAALEYQAQWRWQGTVWGFFAVVAHRERLRAIRRRIIGATEDFRKLGEAARDVSAAVISCGEAFAAIDLGSLEAEMTLSGRVWSWITDTYYRWRY